ncbi:MAG: hypothetical protein WA615_27625, partial [Bradyrhizobium sp.]
HCCQHPMERTDLCGRDLFMNVDCGRGHCISFLEHLALQCVGRTGLGRAALRDFGRAESLQCSPVHALPVSMSAIRSLIRTHAAIVGHAAMRGMHQAQNLI